MRKAKYIGICGLITGIVELSQAGFKDALKSAAGGALNDIAGSVIVTNSNSNSLSKEGLNSLPQSTKASVMPVEIKDESSVSKDDFMAANNFSEADYTQWLRNTCSWAL